jgi:hypothetical protein
MTFGQYFHKLSGKPEQYQGFKKINNFDGLQKIIPQRFGLGCDKRAAEAKGLVRFFMSTDLRLMRL